MAFGVRIKAAISLIPKGSDSVAKGSPIRVKGAIVRPKGSTVTAAPILGAIIGDSNAVGIANFNATGQSDSSYGVSNVTGYAPVTMNSSYATAIADPLVLNNTGTETLRAYAAPPASNMGTEQTLGRYLFQYGIASAPILVKFGVSGSTQHTHWRTDSTFPVIGGNMNAQCVSYLLAREAEFGRGIDYVVIHLGENDTSSSVNANATQADLSNIISGIRIGLGKPTLPVFLVIMNASTTGAFAATVQAGQKAYVASDQFCRGVYVDDIPLAANPHYGANGYYDVGNRVAAAIATYFYPAKTFDIWGGGAIPGYQQAGAGITTAASTNGIPREGPAPRDGDLELLVATSQATDTTYSLVTPNGFTAVNAKFQSIFGGTNFRTMGVWYRLVDQATLNANNGLMPDPVVNPGTVGTTEWRIFGFRGPNKWTSNPIEQFATAANNANNTSLSIPTVTTVAANQLVVLLCSVPQAGASVSSVVNGNLAAITKQWDGTVSQAATLGLALHTATKAAAGATGATAVTMSTAGNHVGCILTIKP